MLVYGKCECFVMQVLYVCVLCASCGSSQCCVLHDLQFVNAGRGCNRRPYRRGILQSRSHNCFIGSHECLLLFTPSCCSECYVDVQPLYPYVCKIKHYPIGHPRCLIGPDLRKFGMDVNKFDGLVKCKVLSPRGIHIPLLPSHIIKKLMFVLCRKCAETENQSICNHSVGDRSLSGTWVSVELQIVNL